MPMKALGGQQAAFRVLPAHQRLGADAATPVVHLGLQVQAQLAAADGLAQLPLDAEALLGEFAHAGFEEGRLVSAGFLGAMQRGIGPAQHFARRIVAAVGAERDADARRQGDFLVSGKHEGQAQVGVDFLGYGQGAVGSRFPMAVQTLQQDGEFVGAHARQGVAIAQQPEQAAAQGDQQGIAHRMAARIVEHLEAVDIDQQQRAVGSLAQRQRQRQIQAVFEQHAIGQSGQRVVMRQPDQLLVAGLHRFGHAVEAVRQLADFVVTGRRDAYLVVARGQFVRARLQPCHPPDDQYVQQQAKPQEEHGIADQTFDQAIAPGRVHMLLELGLRNAYADDAPQIADPVVERRVVFFGDPRGGVGARAVALQARRLDADRRGVMEEGDAVVFDDIAHSLRRSRIGAKPADRVHLEAIRHVVRVARTIRDILEADAAVAPVGKLARDLRERVGGQQSSGGFVDRQAASDELVLINATHRHHKSMDVASVVLALQPRGLGKFVPGRGDIHRQHHAHQQAERQPDFLGELHAASVSEDGGPGDDRPEMRRRRSDWVLWSLYGNQAN